jgi:NAD(P)-dependent dehydrogenase (short-subunit alcohol dehydrogenase family)
LSGRLPGRFALDTGGVGGSGAACVLALLEEGCNVTATGLNEAEIDTLRDYARCNNVNWLVLDVADNAQVEGLAQATPQLDVLVNRAGIVLRQDAAFSEDGFARVMDINVAGTMRCCRAFLPQLQERPGTIVNIASMISYFGSGTAPGCAPSKGAVAQLTKNLPIARAPQGIRVNAIASGRIEMPIRLLQSSTMTNLLRSGYDLAVARTPMGGWGQSAHIGRLLPRLCDDAAAWITGLILSIEVIPFSDCFFKMQ